MRRIREESGFTLIEVLAVVVIIAVLVAVAVPAYLSFKGTAQTAGARSNVRSAIPAAEEMSNANGTYVGITGDALRATAPGIGPAVLAVAVHSNLGYCIQDTEDNGSTFYNYVGGNAGPALRAGYSPAAIQPGTCLQAVGVAAN